MEKGNLPYLQTKPIHHSIGIRLPSLYQPPMFFLLCGFAVFLIGVHPVSACDDFGCQHPSIRPANGAQVPSSVQAIVYRHGYDFIDSDTNRLFRVSDVELLSSEDIPLSFKMQRITDTFSEESMSDILPDDSTLQGGCIYLVQPDSPFESGETYRIKYPWVCPDQESTEQTFTVGPPVDKPKTIGTMVQTGHNIEKIEVRTYSGDCWTKIIAAVAHISFTPSYEQRAYLAVTDLRTIANGQLVNYINYTEPSSPTGDIEFDVYAGCIVNDENAEHGLDPGTYQLELQAHINGESKYPLPIATSITLQCEDQGEKDKSSDEISNIGRMPRFDASDDEDQIQIIDESSNRNDASIAYISDSGQQINVESDKTNSNSASMSKVSDSDEQYTTISDSSYNNKAIKSDSSDSDQSDGGGCNISGPGGTQNVWLVVLIFFSIGYLQQKRDARR